MSAPDRSLSPELTEILEDLARDPGPNIFTMQAERVATRLFLPLEAKQITGVRKSAAERELLGAHRAELAWLLRDAYLRTREVSSRSCRRYMYEGEVLEAEEGQLRAAVLNDDPHSSTEWQRELALLQFATRAQGREIDPIALLSASLVLESAPNARVYLAAEQVTNGSDQDAASQLKGLLGARPGRDIVPYAWQGLGIALDSSGELPSAELAFKDSLNSARRSGGSMACVCAASIALVLYRVRESRFSTVGGLMGDFEELDSELGQSMLRSATDQIVRDSPGRSSVARVRFESRVEGGSDALREFIQALR